GLGAAFARYWSDGSIRRPQDLESAGIAVLGVVPELGAAAAQQLGQGDVQLDARQQRDIDSAWGAWFSVARTAGATIAMVGDGRAPGVTSLSLQFAVRLARCLHLRVLLVETNCQRPALAARLACGSGPGFADLISGTVGRDDVLRQTVVPG